MIPFPFLRTALLLLLLAASAVTAQIPRLISYQGLLANPDGTLVPDGLHNLRVRIYTQPTGGTEIYDESHTSIPVTRGVFSIEIGSIVPLSPSFDRPYYLGVSVDGGAELQPRTPLTSAPYALVAGEALTLSDNATDLVKSVNGASGAVVLRGAGSTTINRSGDTITIGSSGGSGGTGVQGAQSSSGEILVSSPNGPVIDLGLADGSVTTAKLAAGAVTSDRIADGAVTAAKIGAGAVTTTAIAPGAITNDRIANGAVTGTKIADSAVTTAKIARYAITQDRLDTTIYFPPRGNAGGDLTGTYPNPTIGVGMVTSAKITDGTITGTDVSASAALAVGSVTTSGNISAGTTNTAARLTVYGSGTTPATTALRVADNNGTAILSVLDNGATGVGTTTPGARLEVAGPAGGAGLAVTTGSTSLSVAVYVPIPTGTGGATVAVAAGVSVARIADDAANLPIAITLPAGRPGEIIIVSNDDAANGGTVGIPPAPIAIAVGQTRMFVFNGVGWRLVN